MLNLAILDKRRFGQGLVALVILLLCLPSTAAAQEFSAEFIEDHGYVSLIRIQGNYDADGSVADPDAARQEITKAFYTIHGDVYDFIVIFTDFDFNMPETEIKAFYTHIRNDTEGIGRPLIDNSQLYGSNGVLQGTVDMGNLYNLPVDPSSEEFSQTMTVMSHELLHRWSAYVSYIDDQGEVSKALLSPDEAHWNGLLDSQGSVQYGNTWQDNGDGTFTTLKGGRHFSDLDLYLMGLKGASEVAPLLLIIDPSEVTPLLPQEGFTISGTASYVDIDDIIAAEGARVPSHVDSPKDFKIGYIFASYYDELNILDRDRLAALIRNWETWFSSQTRGRAKIYTDWDPVTATPENPGTLGVSGDYLAAVDPDAGINWLLAQQQGDGSWMDSAYTIGRDTAAAVETLALLLPGGSNYSAGIAWIGADTAANNEMLARQIGILSADGGDVTALADLLVAAQNQDGGWGTNPHYQSNPKDTACALEALQAAGISDSAIIDPAIACLQSHQSSEDGGWGDLSAASSAAVTASVLDTLKRFNSDGSLDVTIQQGLTYLGAQQNANGGFGGGDPTVYDTAEVVNALYDLDDAKTIVRAAAGFLKSRQFTDGSWQSSPYQTALALEALELGDKEADLAIAEADLAVTPNPVTVLPSTVTLTAVIRNIGTTEALSATVALYADTVDAANLLDERVVDIGPAASVNLSFDIDIVDTQTSIYHLVADPADTIYEMDETNNSATVGITYDVSEFYGDDGDNVLTGDDGNDLLDGGAGNDILDGGQGDDIYVFASGYGNDTVAYTAADIGGLDVVAITGGLTTDDLAFARNADDLVITLTGSADTLTITNFFLDVAGDHIVDEIRLDDGTVMTVDDFAYLSATAGDDIIDGGPGDDTIDGLAGNDVIYGHDGHDTLIGGDGNDRLEGGNGNDTLEGGDGIDRLYGGIGNDTLHGGPGQDYLYGEDGSNTYLFGSGEGFDTIYSLGTDGGIDILEIGSGLLLSDLDFSRDNNYLKILIAGTDDYVSIYNYFSTGLVEEIHLDDGSILNQADVVDILQVVTEGDDVLMGYDADEEIAGLGGNDTIKGMGGNDILIGGAGDDQLDGGNGNDTYRYALGDGQDIIYSQDTGDTHFDVIELLAGIDPNDVVLQRYATTSVSASNPGYPGESDLILVFPDGGSIRIRDYFFYGQYRLDEIRFAGGEVWDIPTVIAKVIGVTSDGDDTFLGVVSADTLIGGPGNDTLYGRGASDILDGGPGDDFLAGGPDHNTYYFGPGYGADTIDNDNSVRSGGYWVHSQDYSILKFKEGIAPGDLIARRTGDNLRITFNNSTDSLLIINHFELDAYGDERLSGEIVAFHFFDGTIWYRAAIDALCLVATEGDDEIGAFETDDTFDGLGGNDKLYGYEGQDNIVGGAGNDLIYGGEDDDHLDGGAGGDTLNGGSGDDVLTGRTGNDVIRGDSGNDQLYGDPGDDTLTGGTGNDRFFFAPGFGQDTVTDMRADAGNMDRVYLTAGLSVADVSIRRRTNDLEITLDASGDRLTVNGYFLLSEHPSYPGQAGRLYFASSEILSITEVRTMAAANNIVTEGADELFGDTTDDTIDGLGGDDLIIGEAGNDTLSGGDGNDSIEGGDGHDILRGDAGIDTLKGGDGDDELYGGTENDDLDGGLGNDTLNGDAGDDTLTGGAGDDILRGGDGDDSLDGQDGNDQLYGGAGADNIDGGFGDDTLNGEAGADWLYGSNGADTLDGGEDNDTLYGDDGDDQLLGGGGDDVLYGDYGEDTLSGGVGNDTLWATDDVYDTSDNTLQGDGGDDTLYGSYGSETYHYQPGDGRDQIVESPEVIGGLTSQPDRLVFGAGIASADLILSRRGDDLIVEFDGAPTDGLTIQDWFQSTGPLYKIETFVFPDLSEWTVADIESRVVYYGTDGDDTLVGSDAYDDQILGGAGEDYIEGRDGQDNLDGGTENDTLRGGSGDDVLNGGAGNDFVYGDEGDDELIGGDGNDQLTGGAGNDLLTGGPGDDKYVLGAGFGIDTIDNSGGGIDWILFGDDLTADRLNYEQAGDDLVIKIDDGVLNRLTITGWFADPANRVDYVQPSGGTGISADQIEQMIDPGGGDDGIPVPDESTFDALRHGTEAGEQVLGTNGADLIRGYGGDDDIFAFDGDDWLLGGDGGDYLDGGTGDDMLYGAAGDDRYVFSPGYGHETIDNSGGGVDWLLFTDTLTIDVLVFERAGDDLLIKTDDVNDTVTVKNWFVDDDYKLTYIQPAGGSGMTASAVESLIDTGGGSGEGEDLVPDESTFDVVTTGTDGAEQVIGTAGNDLLRGLAGDDQLYGLSGNDWLVGGDGADYFNAGDGDDNMLGGPGNDQLGGDAGNDFMRAGSGDDIYVFSPGAGADTIDNQDGGTDWLIFTDTLTIDVLEFHQETDDLLIKVVDSTDQVTVLNWFVDPESQIDYIQPAGGSGIPPAQINQMLENTGGGSTGEGEELIPDESTFDAVFTGTDGAEQVIGTPGNDLLRGLAGDDQLFALSGDDWLTGGDGADYFDAGAGNDFMLGGPGDDQLGGDAGNDFMRAGSGDDIYVYRPGSGADTVDNQDGGTDWIIFTDDLTEDRLSFLHIGDDLVIMVDMNPATQIVVTDWFLGDTHQVDYVQPAGGYGIPAAIITQNAVVP